jgi:hypothetical protein
MAERLSFFDSCGRIAIIHSECSNPSSETLHQHSQTIGG